MKKTILTAAFAAVMAFGANADLLRVTLNDGTSTTFNVDNIKEMTFEEEPSDAIAGEYKGVNSVAVGEMATYDAEITYTVTENPDGTINLHVPTYSLSGTVMGDLTLGEYDIPNIPFDESKNAYYREYGEGLSFHFTAVKGEVTTMDNEYAFKADSSIDMRKTETGLKVVNTFQMGTMPFRLTATFTESK